MSAPAMSDDQFLELVELVKGSDTVELKLTVNDIDILSPEFRRSKHVGVETDVMPGGYVCSASMKGDVTGEQQTKTKAALEYYSSILEAQSERQEAIPEVSEEGARCRESFRGGNGGRLACDSARPNLLSMH